MHETATGNGYRFYARSCFEMEECETASIALTITSPPYWNAIDYDIHTSDSEAWHREREYAEFGQTFEDYLANIKHAFAEVHRVTLPGGFCAIVIGTILYKGNHYPVPMAITGVMQDAGWDFHQDIVWNKVTGGVRRAGCFIQNPRSGYYYPNIMTEYILVFRKAGQGAISGHRRSVHAGHCKQYMAYCPGSTESDRPPLSVSARTGTPIDRSVF